MSGNYTSRLNVFPTSLTFLYYAVSKSNWASVTFPELKVFAVDYYTSYNPVGHIISNVTQGHEVFWVFPQ